MFCFTLTQMYKILQEPDDNSTVLNKFSISIMKYDGMKFVISDAKFFLQDS